MDTEYLKRVGIYILVAILSIGIVFYAGYHIWHTFTRELETSPVVESSLEDTIQCTSYIFRTEQVLYGNTSGSVVPTVDDGENVRKNGKVAEIFSINAPGIVSQITEIDDRIELLESTIGNENVSLKGAAQSENEINNVLAQIRTASDNGDVSSVSSLRTTLVSLLNKRKILTDGVGSDISAEITNLQNQRSTLRASLGSLLDTISTPVSGFYYAETDGFESVFDAEKLGDTNYTNLMKFLQSSPESTSNAVGKIVTKSRWYLVCLLDTSYKNTYAEGDVCIVHANEADLEMDVYKIYTDSEGIALVLTTDIMPKGFSFTRSQEVSLVTKTYSGMSIPVSAIRIINGETGVYILDGPVVRFRRVEITYRGESENIVSINSNTDLEENEIPWIEVNDALITEGKGLYDGKVIGN